MKIGEISELHLAAIVAGATLLGGVSTSFVNYYLIDAKTEKETDVQILELAIGILSSPIEKGRILTKSEVALRSWAFDTINSTSEIKFDESLKESIKMAELSANKNRDNEIKTLTNCYLNQNINCYLNQNIEKIDPKLMEKIALENISQLMRFYNGLFSQQSERELPSDNKP